MIERRRKIVAGNWKMYLTLPEARELALQIVTGVMNQPSPVSVILAPSFPFLSTVHSVIEGRDNILLAAQNLHEANLGAFTGEVSAAMLRSVGCKAVIIGHSERRQIFGETDERLARKMTTALSTGFTPIFCIGETLQERQQNQTFSVIERQLSLGLFGLGETDFEKVIIAYEPVWAIGTGQVASDTQAQEVHGFIREKIAQNYSPEISNQTTILYGGSVKPENALGLFSQPDIDGGLIGGASLKAKDFLSIIESATKAYSA
ncbi:MAG: triose-phosphate isomerase [Bacteroidia bacterium]|nr:triose-phosphate isomerase [Bacteroidia bacterium]